MYMCLYRRMLCTQEVSKRCTCINNYLFSFYNIVCTPHLCYCYICVYCCSKPVVYMLHMCTCYYVYH